MKVATEYRGAETCDLVPQWLAATGTHEALLWGCWSHPHDTTPLLVMADYLEEIGDERYQWLRIGCDLWEKAARLKPANKPLDYNSLRNALSQFGVAKSASAHRIAGMFGALLARFAPSGDGSNRSMFETWADARVVSVNNWCWLWSLGMVDERQADAAGSQAYAAGSQAYAAWSQADAAGSQAYAAGSQAYAAWRQADAVGSQAYAAERQAWKFTAALWELVRTETVSLHEGTR